MCYLNEREVVQMKELETEQLLLRKYKEEDYKEIYENLTKEGKAQKCIGYPVHQNVDETKKMVNSFVKEFELGEPIWAMEEKETHQIIGFIQVTELSKQNQRCEINFGMMKEKINYISAEAAIKTTISYLQEEGYQLVISKFYDENEEWTKIKSEILEKAGMKKEAILKDRKIDRLTGKKENYLIYSTIK